MSGILGLRVKLDPGFVQRRVQISPRTFLMRILHNLKQIYQSSNQVQNALYIIKYMRITDPSAAVEIRDEGLCLYALKRFEESAAVLADYLRAAPDALDATTVVSYLERARAKSGKT